jgi:hypothetical protein
MSLMYRMEYRVSRMGLALYSTLPCEGLKDQWVTETFHMHTGQERKTVHGYLVKITMPDCISARRHLSS